MVLRAIWSGRSAMNAEQQKLDSISNNLANVNTPGYKRSDVNFQDLVYESLKRTGYPTNDNQNNILNGTGVKIGRWTRDTRQGELLKTDANTDFALDGEGYFRVTLSDGTKGYERSGYFRADKNGQLVDANGNRLDMELTAEGQDLFNSGVGITNENFSVKETGELYLDYNGGKVYYGKINVYSPVSEDSLNPLGQNLYALNQGGQMNGAANTSILQGFTENSNVDSSKEVIDMIVAQRAFEMGSRALKTGDEMWGMINSLKGR